MKKSKKKISTPVGITIILIVVFVIFGGVFSWEKYNTLKDSKIVPKVVKKDVKNEISADQYDNWDTYNWRVGKEIISFKYPSNDGWMVNKDYSKQSNLAKSEVDGLLIFPLLSRENNIINIDGIQNSCSPIKQHTKCLSKDGHTISTDSKNQTVLDAFDFIEPTFKLFKLDNITTINKRYSISGNYLLWSDSSDNDQYIYITDPQNLVYVGAGYLKDDKNIYTTSTAPFGIVNGLSPNQIKIYPTSIKNNYFLKKGNLMFLITDYFGGTKDDNNKEYIFEAELKNVDINSFEVLDGPFARDKQSVFYISYGMESDSAEKIEGADPRTFRLLGKLDRTLFGLSDQYEADKNNVYLGERKLVDANPNDFYIKKFYNYKYQLGISGKNVYSFATKLDGVDANNIIIEQNGGIIRDNDTAWYMRCINDGFWYVPASEISDPENYKVDGECPFWLDPNE